MSSVVYHNLIGLPVRHVYILGSSSNPLGFYGQLLFSFRRRMKLFLICIQGKDGNVGTTALMRGESGELDFVKKLLEAMDIVSWGVEVPEALEQRSEFITAYCAGYAEGITTGPENVQVCQAIVVGLVDSGLLLLDGLNAEARLQVEALVHNNRQKMGVPAPKSEATALWEQGQLILGELRTVVDILKRVEARVDEVDARVRQTEEMVSTMAEVTVAPRRVYRCGYCKVDDHVLEDCTDKTMCIRCGLYNHREEDCYWASTICSACRLPGHTYKIHNWPVREERHMFILAHKPEFLDGEAGASTPAREGKRSMSRRRNRSEEDRERKPRMEREKKPRVSPWMTGSGRYRKPY